MARIFSSYSAVSLYRRHVRLARGVSSVSRHEDTFFVLALKASAWASRLILLLPFPLLPFPLSRHLLSVSPYPYPPTFFKSLKLLARGKLQQLVGFTIIMQMEWLLSPRCVLYGV